MAPKPVAARRKQFQIAQSVIAALEALSRDSGVSIHQLAEDALRDLLRKHRRPVTFKDALRESAREQPANDRAPRLSEPKSPSRRSARKP